MQSSISRTATVTRNRWPGLEAVWLRASGNSTLYRLQAQHAVDAGMSSRGAAVTTTSCTTSTLNMNFPTIAVRTFGTGTRPLSGFHPCITTGAAATTMNTTMPSLNQNSTRVGNIIVRNQRISQQQHQQLDFSTAVQVDEEPAKPTTTKTTTTTTTTTSTRKSRRTLIDDKNPIVLTDSAAARIQELLSGVSAIAVGAVGLRLGVKRRGCNGLSYTLNYATVETVQSGKDIAMESHGIKVYIEPMALFNVVGTVMDWQETEMASEFTFKNPNSKGECGCGESFNV